MQKKIEKCKRLRWLLRVNKQLKTGLILTLVLFLQVCAEAQIYFNQLYNGGVGTFSVVSLPDGYFLPTQIQPGNTVGIASIQTDFSGTITGGDTTTVLGYGLFPRLPGSSKLINKNVFFLGILQRTSTDFKGGLFKYNGRKNKEVNRFKYQDSISVFFSSMDVIKKSFITITGLAQKFTGGQNVYQSQLLLLQLDTLGNKLWERSYPAKAGLWHLQGNTVINTQDGGYAVGGFGYNNGDLQSSTAYILVCDSIGQKVSERYFDNTQHGNSALVVQQKQNGNFLCAYSRGYQSNGSSSNERAFYVAIEELDKNTLQTIWKREYLPGFRNIRRTYRLIPQNDSTFLIAGTYRPDYILYEGDYASQLGYIFAINSQGDSLWYRDYSNQTDSFEYNYLNDIAITPDGGIVGAGRLQTPNSPYTGGLANHVWLFKTDSIGCLYAGCDTVYKKPKPPITEFKVYPNPAQAGQSLTIELPNATTATASLFNAVGQLVFMKELEFINGTAHLSPPEAKAGGRKGVYILRLETAAGKSYIERIVLY